ncbi:MAG: hypothetical protein O2866_01580 [archaeon]|nr:hypothetical protein [archaeon]MDA1167553.1 hypothetical protein [archaeon]
MHEKNLIVMFYLTSKAVCSNQPAQLVQTGSATFTGTSKAGDDIMSKVVANDGTVN